MIRCFKGESQVSGPQARYGRQPNYLNVVYKHVHPICIPICYENVLKKKLDVESSVWIYYENGGWRKEVRDRMSSRREWRRGNRMKGPWSGWRMLDIGSSINVAMVWVFIRKITWRWIKFLLFLLKMLCLSFCVLFLIINMHSKLARKQ